MVSDSSNEIRKAQEQQETTEKKESFENKLKKIEETLKTPDQANEKIGDMFDQNFKTEFDTHFQKDQLLQKKVQDIIKNMESTNFQELIKGILDSSDQEKDKDQKSIENLMTFLGQYKKSDLATESLSGINSAGGKQEKYNENKLVMDTLSEINKDFYKDMPGQNEIKTALSKPTKKNIQKLQIFLLDNFPSKSGMKRGDFLKSSFKINKDGSFDRNQPDGKFGAKTNSLITSILEEYKQLQTSNSTAQQNSVKIINDTENSRIIKQQETAVAERNLAIKNLPAEERYKFENAKEGERTTLDIEGKGFKYAKSNGDLFARYDSSDGMAQYRKFDLKTKQREKVDTTPISPKNIAQKATEQQKSSDFSFNLGPTVSGLTYINKKNFSTIFDTPKAKQLLPGYSIDTGLGDKVSIKLNAGEGVNPILFKKGLEESLKEAGVKTLDMKNYKFTTKGTNVDSLSFDIGKNSTVDIDQLKLSQAPQNKRDTISAGTEGYKYAKIGDRLYTQKDGQYQLYNNKPNDWISLGDENDFKTKLAELAGKDNRSPEIDFNNGFKFQYAQVDGALVSKQVGEKPVFQKFDTTDKSRKDYGKIDPVAETRKLAEVKEGEDWKKIPELNNDFEYLKSEGNLYLKTELADNGGTLFLKYNKEKNSRDQSGDPKKTISIDGEKTTSNEITFKELALDTKTDGFNKKMKEIQTSWKDFQINDSNLGLDGTIEIGDGGNIDIVKENSKTTIVDTTYLSPESIKFKRFLEGKEEEYEIKKPLENNALAQVSKIENNDRLIASK